MQTNDNKMSPASLVREECFAGIYNARGELKAVMLKDVLKGGAPQVFTVRRANYTTFLEVLTMLATSAQRVVQPVEKVGIAHAPIFLTDFTPKLSPRYPQDVRPRLH